MNFAKIFAENRANIISQRDKNKILTLSNQIKTLETSDLINIKGVGEGTVRVLIENGISTIDQLKEKGIEGIKGLNPISGKSIENFLKN